MIPRDRSFSGKSELSPSWSTKPLKYMVAFNPEVWSEDTREDQLIQYLDIGAVDGNGRIKGVEELTFGAAPSRARRIVRVGDVIVSTVRTYLKAIATITEEGMTVSTGFAVLRAGPHIDSRFLGYWMRSISVVDEIVARSTGVSYPAINPSEVGQIPFPAIAREEQRAIADFLDRETARIDDLLIKQQALFTSVSEVQDAETTLAVTAGAAERLKPGLQASTVQAELPTGWIASRLRHLLQMRRIEVQDGNHGELHPTAADYVPDGIPFVMASDLGAGGVDLNGCKFITEEKARGLRVGFSRPQDVLLSHKGTLGAVAIVPENLAAPFLMLTPQVTYYRVLDQSIRARYLYYLLSSRYFKQQLEYLAAGQATRAYVGIVAQRELLLVLPPVEQQIEMLKRLDQWECQIRKLTTHIERQIELLRSQRMAIISAAVTGQIDVRNYRAKEATAAVCL